MAIKATSIDNSSLSQSTPTIGKSAEVDNPFSNIEFKSEFESIQVPLSSSIEEVNPSTLAPLGFSSDDQNIIPNNNISGSFLPGYSQVELHIYDSTGNLLTSEYNFKNWAITGKDPGEGFNDVRALEVFPDGDVFSRGFDAGVLHTVYNFVNPQLSSSIDNPYFISEISSDRTEIRIQNNSIDNDNLKYYFDLLKGNINDPEIFDEFYINFGDNKSYIGVNIQLDTETSPHSILIKLYNPLPNNFNEKDTLYINTRAGENKAYRVEFIEDTQNLDNITYLRGPNTNLDIKDIINPPTELKSQKDLLETNSTSSKNNLQSKLNNQGIQITPDYSIDNFEGFIHFSSAKQRILNFVYKVKQIEDYNNDLTTLNGLTNSNTSESISSIETNIENIIKNFDGYEYYLYYTSGSDSYPKSTNTFPYELQSTGSTEVLEWLGSDVENSQYYGGILLSASRYDENNPNWLYYTIPEFIRENEDNSNYLDYINMIGQHFDELWLYTKTISEKNKNVNTLDEGVPLKLSEETIKSLGYPTFGSNYSNLDLFISLTGENNRNYLVPTGSELIEEYIAVNSSSITTNFPYEIDKVNQEIFKRLYHNSVYLAKKKGTISGLRQLINIWGIPDTILRINEFGGKDKDNINDFDYWQTQHNLALTLPSSSVTSSLSINPDWGIVDNKPNAVEFRFKSTNPPQIPNSQSIFSTDGGMSLNLKYDTNLLNSGSYSGSIPDNFLQYGTLEFIPDSNNSNNSASVYLPFFNNDWWSVLLNRENGNVDLYVKNSFYNGYDNNKIGYEASSSVPITNEWINSTTIFFPGNTPYPEFTGSLQELRYYKNALSESVFNDYVMNPNSIEGNNLNSSAEELTFRLPLGGELYINSSSVHPKSSGKWLATTSSFLGGGNEVTLNNPKYEGNTETVFLDQPSIGIRNRVSDKIKIDEGSSYGDILTLNNSIQQDYQISQSYNENINSLEVAFSPQEEINNDIINTIGYGIVTDILADPRTNSSSNTFYPDLRKVAEDYFKKYSEGNIYDYLRLIKYFDNSLFKAIKNYTPARTGISTGVVIKQHLLERNKNKPTNINQNTKIASTPSPSFNTPLIFQNHQVTSSIEIGEFEGGTGGVVEQYNYKGKPEFSIKKIIKKITPSWKETKDSPVGNLTKLRDNQKEFYDGDYSGSNLEVSDTVALENLFLEVSGEIYEFDSYLYSSSYTFPNFWLNDENSSPNSGQIDIYKGDLNYQGKQVDYGDPILINRNFTNGGGGYENPTYDNDLHIIRAVWSLSFDPEGLNYNGNPLSPQTESINTLIEPSFTEKFQNSDFQVNLNNFNENRKNRYLYEVDYSTDSIIPVNRISIISGSAIKAQTPDSNYTSEKHILPRYKGSKVISVDYNKFTNPTSNYKFLNGDTGSWGGDESYGKSPSITKNPVYFAHFKSSKQNVELFDTYTFDIDALIPLKNVSLNSLPTAEDPNPKNIVREIEVNGDGNRLIDISSIFEKNRTATVIYDNPFIEGIDLKSVKTHNNLIYQAGIDFNTYFTTEIFKYEFAQTVSFFTASWNQGIDSMNNPSNQIFTADNDLEGFLITGSNFFTLQGRNSSSVNLSISSSIDASTPIEVNGPDLGLIHSFNYAVKNQTTASNSSPIGIPQHTPINPEEDENYWRFSYETNNNLKFYEKTKVPFLIEPGDELRITWNTIDGTPPSFATQEFTITNVTSSQPGDLGYQGGENTYYDSSITQSIPASTVINRIEVSPDPSTLNIPGGYVNSFTINKRIDADNKVILYQQAPSGSQGASTPSKQGFIIPGDLSPKQKDEVLSIINDLRDKNAFPE